MAAASPIDTDPYPLCLERPLGAAVADGHTTFALWAPTASAVTLRLFTHGSDSEAGDRTLRTIALSPHADGSWTADLDGNLSGVYYDYLVTFPYGTVQRTADPWARAAGVNGRRSMVIDLRSTDPDGWDDDRRPDVPPAETVVWETHIGDFSNDPHGGIPAAHRGKYLAFADRGTGVDGERSGDGRSGDGRSGNGHPSGVDYLRRLGVTAVQLLPFYDYGSVDESGGPQFNWGYDPVNYNVPEGSYSTNPYDGAVRIRECKTMIQSLHAAGIKVIMDVVYNHMFSPDNWFERTVPGYYCRRWPYGALANGSGCGCDMASERAMFRRFIVESVTYWAREYHIDGFRFDLMGLIDVDTMNAVRDSLDTLPGGESILMYGEPWSAGPTCVPEGVTLANKDGLAALNPRIGHFCDTTRDAIKGHVFYPERRGYVNGDAAGNKAAIQHAVDAWREPGAFGEGEPGQIIQYVSAHDDLTLWDKLCMSMCPDVCGDGVAAGNVGAAGDGGRGGGDVAGDGLADADDRVPAGGRVPAEDVFDVRDGRCRAVLAANRIAAGLTLTAAGIPFMLAGEEFARTKYGDDNSYDSGIALNQLDWRRSVRLGGLVDYYAALIALRRSDPCWFDAPRQAIDVAGDVVAFRVKEYAVFANPDDEARRALVSAVGAAAGAADAVAGTLPQSASPTAPSTEGAEEMGRYAAETGPDGWRLVLSSDWYDDAGVDAGTLPQSRPSAVPAPFAEGAEGAGRCTAGEWFVLPPRSFTVWKRA
ncbi:alpha-amylase family glycosyl hydrolase [Bifidobacterium leontopitheci]|nr:alpha-amylase family glycosyl hydrolase [Bifidobacterium leontopitheci]